MDDFDMRLISIMCNMVIGLHKYQMTQWYCGDVFFKILLNGNYFILKCIEFNSPKYFTGFISLCALGTIFFLSGIYMLP